MALCPFVCKVREWLQGSAGILRCVEVVVRLYGGVIVHIETEREKAQ